ncbi:MAG: hypothetical protein J7L82_06535 [Staphylothermus sp.]|nr:hypothetical protein [Staphylothermus sp.]
MFGNILYYIVPETIINSIYLIEEILCILMIMLLVIISLFESRSIYTKALFTLVGLITLALHYYVILYMTRFERILIYPILIVETTAKGSSISIDFGQLILLGILIIWRKQVINYFEKILKRSRESVVVDNIEGNHS